MYKIILAISLILFPLLDAAAAVIRLLPEAKACGLRVLLGQIAEIKSEDPELLKKLKTFMIMPLPQKEKWITMEEIQRRLFYQIKEDMVFIGEKTLVKPVYTRILETEIIEKIRSAAVKNYPEISFEKMGITLMDSIPEIKIPYGEIEIRPYIPGGGKFSDIKMVRADILIDNTVYMNRSFRVKFSTKKP